ncbi:MAG: xanthine dehydrogenase accessory protein XdhC [Hyphomicrobiales bacterium]|nr:MAG: xanthine dehydrogenase accessory protein XdhC [Hyphomicrobiales bacterium]
MAPSAANAATGSAGLGPVDWIGLARDAAANGRRAVLALIVDAAGSAPRGEGTWLLVDADTTYGTLGGGELERIATLEARAMIAGERPWTRGLSRRALGPDLGQCCGGAVVYLAEPIDSTSMTWLDPLMHSMADAGDAAIRFALSDAGVPPTILDTAAPAQTRIKKGQTPDEITLALHDPRPHLVICGAGHVGRTLAAFATSLPLRTHVVDDRPEALALIEPSANLTPVLADDPAAYVAGLATVDAAFVMSYSHDLDFALVRALIARADTRYVGMIGSASKAARALKQLDAAGLGERARGRFVSPIGAEGPPGKEPGIIALGALSEVLRILRPDG